MTLLVGRDWRAGASQPSGTIFLYIRLMYAVMFYVILNKRKRLGAETA